MLFEKMKLTLYWFSAAVLLYTVVAFKELLRIDFNYFEYFFLPIISLMALVSQFGKDETFNMLKKPDANMIKWVPIAVFLSVAIGYLTLTLGRAIGVPSFVVNRGIESLSRSEDVFSKAIFFLLGWIHLVGEELVTAKICIPFTIFSMKYFSKRMAIAISVLISSILFGVIHLPTYDWNIYQSVVIIGFIRLPFTMLWFKAKSILGGAIPHIVFDYIIVLLSIL